ncbi:hypothetical protein HMPREF9466_02738 [Fusobacterium necrophorum subsp. funduliforme 1_1_36S]|nr:hypothetical protein HMPREF9466_02738 [Fusobacterium necrophorum subsp. funduliforme 1_1_36S]
MKIKTILIGCVFLIFSCILFGKEYKPLEQVKKFSFEVTEINYIGKNKKILYFVQMSLPHVFKKEILFPDLNKGEIYLYKENMKTVYLPMFEQKKTMKLEKEELQVLDVIKILAKQLSTDMAFRKEYYDKKNVEFILNENYKAVIQSYSEIDQYLFPKKWLLEEKGQKILELTLSKIEINPNFTERDFQVP